MRRDLGQGAGEYHGRQGGEAGHDERCEEQKGAAHGSGGDLVGVQRLVRVRQDLAEGVDDALGLVEEVG